MNVSPTGVARAIGPGVMIGTGGGLIAAFTSYDVVGIVVSIVGFGALVIGLIWRQVRTSGDVFVRVSVEAEESLPQNNNSEYHLTYQLSEEKDSATFIEPEMGYLNKLASGGPVQDISYSPYPFSVSFPLLNALVTNNSGKTISLTELLLQVEESKLSRSPAIVVANNTRPPRTILLVNEGGGEVGPGTFQFSFRSISETGEPMFDHYALSLAVPRFTRSCFLDLSDQIAAVGVDVQELEALDSGTTIISAAGTQVRLGSGVVLSNDELYRRVREACKPFEYEGAAVVGELEYATNDIEGQRQIKKLKLTTTVGLFKGTGYFPLKGPSLSYDLLLEKEGVNYERRMALKTIIRTGETEAIKFRIGTLAPSVHRARVLIKYMSQGSVESSRLELTIFVPRSSWEDEWWQWLYEGA
jgi:hypothetical protein